MEVEEDENKPFDSELAQDGEEAQPEPDEHMIADSATGRVWIVKVSDHARLVDCRLNEPWRLAVDPKIFNATLGER